MNVVEGLKAGLGRIGQQCLAQLAKVQFVIDIAIDDGFCHCGGLQMSLSRANGEYVMFRSSRDVKFKLVS